MENILFDLSLPIKPISNNNITSDVRHKHKNANIRIKTHPYKEFQRLFSYVLMSKQQMPKEPINEKVNLTIFLDFKDSRPRDVANYEKSITDTLVKYGILKDDNHKIIVSNTQKISKLSHDHFVRILIERASEHG